MSPAEAVREASLLAGLQATPREASGRHRVEQSVVAVTWTKLTCNANGLFDARPDRYGQGGPARVIVDIDGPRVDARVRESDST